MQFTLLECREGILGGKPCIKGTRISVQVILEWISEGASLNDIMTTYPQISADALKEALKFAAYQMQNDAYIQFSNAA